MLGHSCGAEPRTEFDYVILLAMGIRNKFVEAGSPETSTQQTTRLQQLDRSRSHCQVRMKG